jgi:IS6 family transposase
MDKNLAYGQALKELKQEGTFVVYVKHLQTRYCYNQLADHSKLKKLIIQFEGFNR